MSEELREKIAREWLEEQRAKYRKEWLGDMPYEEYEALRANYAHATDEMEGVTDAMIEAGAEELVHFSPRDDDVRVAALMVYQAMARR